MSMTSVFFMLLAYANLHCASDGKNEYSGLNLIFFVVCIFIAFWGDV